MSSQYIVRCYATKNRRAPLIGLIGDWPSRAGFSKMAAAGQKVLVREATQAEASAQDDSPRHMCVRWTSLLDYVRYHRRRFGKFGQGVVIEELRKHWWAVKRCLTEGAKKARRHAQKLAKRRAA